MTLRARLNALEHRHDDAVGNSRAERLRHALSIIFEGAPIPEPIKTKGGIGDRLEAAIKRAEADEKT